ncbi:putative amidohydrolase YtcJ [Microbacterium terrae]|uniref:N-substituted formamide deformylase n=1 Tax=Microbacterium terrae TaxID=69369 RepID=A0A0M2HGN4_9MICO|nr:amidohydrolase family protein [Microbacterium terrae]KJL45852.1 N-substituted formamide deformylase precursor [Microbacterium terrae]MBP1077215.1 putative amidohydrolase YtcJ [Microbacterium terrae]GLJ99808.1 amidohydrolase [Microbacterium terrae]
MSVAAGETVDVVTDVRLAAPERMDPFGDEPVDVHLAEGVIVDIAPPGALPRRGAVLDGAGAWLAPGLWDHHVHVVQWALAAQRTPLGDATSAAQAAAVMGAAAARPDGRRIGTGFRDALWPDRPTVAMLDAATGDVPTYLINADVHSVWLNSAALRRESMTADDSGMLREAPAFEISRRLNAVAPADADAAVAVMTRAAAAKGIVGLVDLDMAWNEEAWARRIGAGFDTLRVEFGIYPDHLDRAIAEGLQTGDVARGAASDLARVGALKVITDGSLGTRTAACSHHYPGDPSNHGLLTVDPAMLVDLMTAATGAGLACAIHAIGDLANTNALDAFAATGAWGSIEHAQLVAHADIPRFGRLGVSASVQPEHAIDDRDLTDTIWAEQTAQPYPLRALADTGANLLFGSDAPVSDLDPWAAIAAAVHRTRGGRPAWQPQQGVDPETALAASTHGGSERPARIEPGRLADLVLCGRDPLTAGDADLRTMPVAATLLGGRLTHVG